MSLRWTSARRALLGLATATLAMTGLVAQAGAIPPGERDVKVVVTKFANQAAYPYAANEARDAVFADPDGNASGFFEALTGGNVSLTGADQVERLSSTLNRGQVSNCNDLLDVLGDIVDQLDNPLGEHDHLIVVGPRVASSCSRSGVAGIGPPGGAGDPGRNWVYLNGRLTHQGESNWRLLAHELTHNFGANHAAACRNGSFPQGDCNPGTYGDPFAIMGRSTGSLAGFPSSWQQRRIGVLGPEHVEEVTEDGVYELTTANDPARAGVKLLMVPREGGGRPFYALGTRTRGDYDDFLAPGARVYNGVTVRTAVRISAPYDTGPRNDTRLVPANRAANERNWPLLACEAYTDSGAGVSIRPLEVDGGTARVQVALGGRSLPDDPECGPGGEPRLHAIGQPRIHRVGRNRKRVSYRFRTRNVGDAPISRVRLCVRAPRKRVRVLGRICVVRQGIDPGGERRRMARVRIRPRARGKLTRIRLTANGPGAASTRTMVRLRVRR